MSNPYTAPGAEMADMEGDDTYTPSMFTLSGRIGRLRYLAYSFGAGMLCAAVIGVLMAVLLAGSVSKSSGMSGAAAILLIIAYIPMIAIGFIFARRRLNDTDNTGWLSLLLIIPFIGFLLWLYMVFAPGTDNRNKYGPAPGPNNMLIVIGGLILPFVVVIGILAAVAIPAYQGYVNKARAAKLEQMQQQQSQPQSQ